MRSTRYAYWHPSSIRMSSLIRRPFLMSLVALYGKLEDAKRYSLIMEFADGGDMYADIVKNQKEGR